MGCWISFQDVEIFYEKDKKINIIYKDDQIVVCEKPKGIPVSSDKTGDMDLLHQLKNQLFFEENTDGEPQLI